MSPKAKNTRIPFIIAWPPNRARPIERLARSFTARSREYCLLPGIGAPSMELFGATLAWHCIEHAWCAALGPRFLMVCGSKLEVTGTRLRSTTGGRSPQECRATDEIVARLAVASPRPSPDFPTICGSSSRNAVSDARKRWSWASYQARALCRIFARASGDIAKTASSCASRSPTSTKFFVNRRIGSERATRTSMPRPGLTSSFIGGASVVTTTAPHDMASPMTCPYPSACDGMTCTSHSFCSSRSRSDVR